MTPPVDTSAALGVDPESPAEEMAEGGELGDLFGAPAAPIDGDSEGDTETDPVFHSDIISVFPDLSDDQVATLQRLIDDRCMAMKASSDPNAGY